MDIRGKVIKFTVNGMLVCDDDGEIFIPAGTRLVIDDAVIKGDKIVLSVHDDKEVQNG